MKDKWPQPSPAAQDVIRRGAERALDPRAEWLEEWNNAVEQGDGTPAPLSDPVLIEGSRNTNLESLLHWASANIQRPGARVPANLSQTVLEATRDLLRRDLDETALELWRVGQNFAWQRWMELCFELTSDPDVLHEVLAVTSRSIATFIDDTIKAVGEVIRQERHELAQGSHPDRLTTVLLLLQGAPVARARAEERLGYALTGSHLAAVVWATGDATGEDLEYAAEQIRRGAGSTRRLTVLATRASLWLWVPASRIPPAGDLEAVLTRVPDVRIALGQPRSDLEGFRQSHLEASTVQQMMARLGTKRQVGTYAGAQLIAMLSADVSRADEFVADTLGDLASAEPELRATLRTYLEQRCNAARTTEAMYAHRNTIVRRVARSEDLLPVPLEENLVAVGAALQLMWWRGDGT
ncbi:MAG: helix-turn-helix domain-containing protein [Nocardioidaceae bacterium]